MSIFDHLFEKSNKGKSWEQITREQTKQGKKRAKESGKTWGECESCDTETVLVEDLGMCGPCTFGEAETINGNW